MIYHCCDARRRELVLADPASNGIDYVEVLDNQAPDNTPRQRTLLLRFLGPAPNLSVTNVELSGGERITGVEVEWITPADAPDLALIDPIEAGLPAFLTSLPQADQVLVLRTNSSGDHSTYTLRLVAQAGALSPPDGIDRVLSRVDFSFKVECPTDFDCAPRLDCPEDALPGAAISYLAKDYRSFKRLMLSRIAQIAPDWRERNPADLGITLVEALAYTADRLSYAQDAMASEAYLATARRRSSVRRHARLVDYHMHDGGNARVWVHLDVAANVTVGPLTEQFVTRIVTLDPVVSPANREAVYNRQPLIFEALHDQPLFPLHNAMDFYEWGDRECCLPKGATRATLAGDFPDLAVGDILIFEERIGPRTGLEADADPSIRHAVRLCAVESGLTDPLPLEPGAPPALITEIRWAEEDALPFPICISTLLDEEAGGALATRVSHALGNIVLCDHGRSVSGEELPSVPQPHLSIVPEPSSDPCEHPDPVPVPVRYRPALQLGPVTQATVIRDPASGEPVEYDPQSNPSAFAATNQDMDNRSPVVRLESGSAPADTWTARRDLLQSFSNHRHFVMEAERDGRARLRFGDDLNGRRPNSGTGFTAFYRIGNGAQGNVGADAIRHVISGQGGITAVRNPLAATGGADAESMEEVRKAAPYAYRRQERAVTPDDYADIALRYPDVQRAVATFRWNGHGHTVFVTVDRFGGRPVTADFETGLRAFLDRFRMAGYDLEIDAPRFVALELNLFVCASPDHFRSEIRREIFEVLSTRKFASGKLGHFHPDNLSFGLPVYLSAIYAAVMAVEGVTSVSATRFRRRGTTSTTPLKDGIIAFGRLEIAQLENDRNFPERGSIEIEMGGGK